MTVGHIDPEMAYWTTSGEFVFVAILSGTGSVAAPVPRLHAPRARCAASPTSTRRTPGSWSSGGAMLLVILFLPGGPVVGLRHAGERRR